MARKKVTIKVEKPSPVIIEDSKQLKYFKKFDSSLIESDIVNTGGSDYFCKKLNKGITM